MRSSVLKTPLDAKSSPPIALTEIGTSCIFSTRRRAVTTISLRPTLGSSIVFPSLSCARAVAGVDIKAIARTHGDTVRNNLFIQPLQIGLMHSGLIFLMPIEQIRNVGLNGSA